MLANTRAALLSLGLSFGMAARAEEPTVTVFDNTPLVENSGLPITIGNVTVEARPAPTPVQDALVKTNDSLQNLGEVMKMTGVGLGVAGLLGGTALVWAARREDRKFANALTVLNAADKIKSLRAGFELVQKWEIRNPKHAARSHDKPSDRTPPLVAVLTDLFLEALRVEEELPQLLLNNEETRLEAGKLSGQAFVLRIQMGRMLGRQLKMYSKECLRETVARLQEQAPFSFNYELNQLTRSLARSLTLD